jgi:hypothetical protein
MHAKPLENTTKPQQPHLKSSENSVYAAELNIPPSYQIFLNIGQNNSGVCLKDKIQTTPKLIPQHMPHSINNYSMILQSHQTHSSHWNILQTISSHLKK